MIKNIIFDIGNVLATFEPKVFLHEIVKDEEKEKRIFNIVFKDMTRWSDYNRGVLSSKELVDALVEIEPELEKEINAVMSDWVKYVLPIESSMKVIDKYLGKYKMYIISDIPEDNYTYLLSTYGFIQKMEGGIFSYQEKILKPDKEMFTRLLDRYGLEASECIFIDDRIDNVNAANEVGIKACQLTDYTKLEELIEKML